MNNTINNSNQTIIPLYEEVRRKMYDDFLELNKTNSLVQTSRNNSELRIAIKVFKEAFITFFGHINHDNKLKKLSKDKKEYLIKAYNNINLIQTSKVCLKVFIICREIMENLGITKIEYTRDENPGAVRYG